MAIGRSAPGLTTTSDPGGAEVTQVSRSLWSAFANARSETALLTSWLAVLVNRVPEATLGVLLRPDPAAAAYVPVAVAPDPRRDLSGLGDIAQKAIASNRPSSTRSGDGEISRVASPVQGPDGSAGYVVVLELKGSDDAGVQQALRDAHWAAGWLSAQLWQDAARDGEARLRRAGVALDILAVAGEHRKPAAAAMAVVNEVQTILDCDQVSIGLIKRRRSAPKMRLLAMSYSAWFRKRSGLAEGIETAMEEAWDQNASVSHPPLERIARAVSVAHGEHVRRSRTSHMITVPLSDEDGPIGAMTCERRDTDKPFDEDTLLLAEAVAALVGPMLALKAHNARWFGGRIVDGVLHVLDVVLGPRHLSWKLLTIVLALLVFAAATVKGPFRVQADAVLRGQEMRAVVAPFAGFIDDAPLRAGDMVAAGDLLVRLDDSDLRLEELRWRSEIDRLISQAREAQAQYDRAQVALLEAQLSQARAQLALAQAELERTRLIAPIDGVIVSGDLSQKLGAPVQLGEVLFEIAPPDRYRVDIYVDERDLPHVETGQPGRLSLAGQPSEGVPFATTRITPIAEIRETRNTFRVEGLLDTTPVGLRPGMEGVAKIEVGRELMVWVWSRRLIDWVRRTLWTWQP
ncbi:efflux RND transporter periplasmic adaptor subunit [Lutimaribacter marinistellae]|uniref:Efflux RND transporter periplasmic adaptor subunit n=1 Tax=Lutimaribacter marinistellae TaxID=1820329 RepID=A0ABV7TKX6_9RHOB